MFYPQSRWGLRTPRCSCWVSWNKTNGAEQNTSRSCAQVGLVEHPWKTLGWWYVIISIDQRSPASEVHLFGFFLIYVHHVHPSFGSSKAYKISSAVWVIVFFRPAQDASHLAVKREKETRPAAVATAQEIAGAVWPCRKIWHDLMVIQWGFILVI